MQMSTLATAVKNLAILSAFPLPLRTSVNPALYSNVSSVAEGLERRFYGDHNEAKNRGSTSTLG